jgi:hypothetical protein
LAWLRAAPDRWLLAGDRWLADCFDLRQAIAVGDDRERTLFLVNGGMAHARCPSAPGARLYQFRWAHPYR